MCQKQEEAVWSSCASVCTPCTPQHHVCLCVVCESSAACSCPLGITSAARRGSARSASVGGSSCHGAQICSYPPPPSLQGQTRRHPLARSSAMLLGSSFVTTLTGWLSQNTQWSKINTPIVESTRSYSSAPSIPRYMSPFFVCLWRIRLFHVALPGKRYLG